ncbi:hypothetical protein ACN3XK_54670 [Actinomadura welshii]
MGVLAAASVVFVVLASLIAFGLRGEPSSEGPGTTSVQRAVPFASPANEPTYGKYVPPEPEPQAATKAPPRPPAPVPSATPRKTKRSPKPTSTPTPTRARRSCPPEWRHVWWMRRWCEGPRDRDGHRGR